MTIAKVQIGIRTWVALLALGLALWVAITYFDTILEVGWILFGAFLLSLATRPVVDWLARWQVPRGLTVLVIYFLLFGLLVLLASLLIPMVEDEISSLRRDSPALIQQVVAQLRATPLAQRMPSLSTIAVDMAQRFDTVLLGAVATVAGLGSAGLNLLVLFVFSYLFTVETQPGHRWLSRWVIPERRPHVEAVVAGIVYRLTRWVWAQAGMALYFGVTSTIALSLMGIPYAVTIGLVGGLLEIVPYLGTIITVFLAVLSALTVNLWLALWVVVFYIVAATVESHVVAPFLYGRAIQLRSAFVLLALVIGAKAEGVIGVFFAVPVAVIVAALAEELQGLVVPDEPAAEATPAALVPSTDGGREGARTEDR